MRVLPAVFLAALLAAGSALAVDPPKDTRTFETKQGNVAFQHTKHLAAGMECGACHHGGEQKKCRTCHGKDVQGKAVKIYDAVHNKTLEHSCLACHAKTVAAGRKAPVECKACHVKA